MNLNMNDNELIKSITCLTAKNVNLHYNADNKIKIKFCKANTCTSSNEVQSIQNHYYHSFKSV